MITPGSLECDSGVFLRRPIHPCRNGSKGKTSPYCDSIPTRPSVAARSEDGVKVVWQDNRDCNYEIYFKQRTSSPICGDANGDGLIDIGDVIAIINYLFKDGPAPIPLSVADVNGDGSVEIGDVICLINYLFKAGPPCCQRNPNS